ncbi:hypothetical protein FACS189465_2940 [Clostridia bacterium]|nr:hypothetical protein FACS189465_2940 [Clostridia bacterium]
MFSMKDVISLILDEDKKSKELISKAKLLKLETEKKIKKSSEDSMQHDLEKAEKNVKILRKTEELKCEKKLQETENFYVEITNGMYKTYQENLKMWVDDVVNQVIKR